MAALMPEGKQSFETAAGIPLVGGKLYTYDAGTNNPRPTYQDSDAIAPNTNPIILDARGEAVIFWSGTYKIVLRDALDNLIWTVDNVVDSQSYSGGLDAALRADLASTIAAAKGAGLVSFVPTLNYAAATVGAALKADRLDVTIFPYNADNTGAADASAAVLAALQTGRPIVMRGIFKFLSTVAYTGKVDILGERCTINSDVIAFDITNGDGSRIRGLNLMPITTPYTLLRNTNGWPNMVAGDVVQSLEGYQPSSQDTDIWGSLSVAIQNQSANQTIRNGIRFLTNTGLTTRKDARIYEITGRAVFLQMQGYSYSSIEDCDIGGGPREGINFLNGQTLARGQSNRIANNKVKYASQCGILWWAQDDLMCYGNDSRLNGESAFKSYQYDGSNTTDVISKRCRVFGNHAQDCYYDGIDMQVWYNVADPGIYTANQIFGNVSKNHRHTCYTTNGEGEVMTANYAELAGSHGISVKSKRAVVTGNKAKNCAQLPAIHAFQIFDILIQGDGINSTGNRVDNPVAANTWNYLHSGVNGALPTVGDEGYDAGNTCSAGLLRLTFSDTIPRPVFTTKVQTITALAYTVLDTDTALSFFTAAACTVTLPDATKSAGRQLRLRNTNAFAINSASNNIGPQAGGAPVSLIIAAVAGKWVNIQCDGANWTIMESN